MSNAFVECMLAALSEAIGLTAVYGILDLIAKIGITVIFKEAGKLALKAILKVVLKEMVPVGLALLVAEIVWHIYWCW